MFNRINAAPGGIGCLRQQCSEIAGVGTYHEVALRSVSLDLGGIVCRILDLDTLIQSEKALGRSRDLQSVIELEAIQQRLQSKKGGR